MLKPSVTDIIPTRVKPPNPHYSSHCFSLSDHSRCDFLQFKISVMDSRSPPPPSPMANPSSSPAAQYRTPPRITPSTTPSTPAAPKKKRRGVDRLLMAEAILFGEIVLAECRKNEMTVEALEAERKKKIRILMSMR